jgi:putrescine aminotransferase
MAASAPVFARLAHTGVPGFVHVPYGDPSALAATLRANAREVAAVLLEPIAVEAGVLCPPNEYLLSVRRLCDEFGVLLVLDESVTGLGRTGALFAGATAEVVPDILVVGRALGGGVYPIHATCHSEKLDAFYKANPFVHISTFAGSEVGCFCAMAALDELSRPELHENARRHGARLLDALRALCAGHPKAFREVRGRGLLIGVECGGVSVAQRMQQALAGEDVLCRRAFLAPEVVLLLPPLTVSEAETSALIDTWRAATDRVAEEAA